MSRRPGRPEWARLGRSVTTRPPRDWLQISITALPGLAAVIALIFTSLSIRATDAQLQITEQGQITDRYNAATTNLGSSSMDVRLGGIYALQRIMQDSPRDQPTVIAVLCAFVRNHAKPAPGKSADTPTQAAQGLMLTDIQAALTVVGRRNTAHDGALPVVDLTNADLIGADLSYMRLRNADLSGADLSGADLSGADLFSAHLNGTDLTSANLAGADLTLASFSNADLTGAHLNAARLSDAFLPRARLTDADLSDADLSGADLTDADLTGTHLARTNLNGATLTGVKGLRTAAN